MDPNVTLTQIRSLSFEIIQLAGDPAEGARFAAVQSALASKAAELAEHTLALDEWLCKGGFLPTAWRTHER